MFRISLLTFSRYWSPFGAYFLQHFKKTLLPRPDFFFLRFSINEGIFFLRVFLQQNSLRTSTFSLCSALCRQRKPIHAFIRLILIAFFLVPQSLFVLDASSLALPNLDKSGEVPAVFQAEGWHPRKKKILFPSQCRPLWFRKKTLLWHFLADGKKRLLRFSESNQGCWVRFSLEVLVQGYNELIMILRTLHAGAVQTSHWSTTRSKLMQARRSSNFHSQRFVHGSYRDSIHLLQTIAVPAALPVVCCKISRWGDIGTRYWKWCPSFLCRD